MGKGGSGPPKDFRKIECRSVSEKILKNFDFNFFEFSKINGKIIVVLNMHSFELRIWVLYKFSGFCPPPETKSLSNLAYHKYETIMSINFDLNSKNMTNY